MDKRVTSLPMNLEQRSCAEDVRIKIGQALEHVEEFVPPGRYQALALTALEQACMWAVKGISHEWQGELDDG